jgi:aromatic ring hydroxylase
LRPSAPTRTSTIRTRTTPGAGTNSARTACPSSIIHPPIDRDRRPSEVSDVCCHVEKETDNGLIILSAKVVTTGSVLTNYTFVALHGLIPVQDKKFAAVFMLPANSPGVRFICRTSYEMNSTVMGSPFDYPLEPPR